jgi:hypothetical protein
MNAFTDPRSAPRNIAAAAIATIGIAAALSGDRLATVAYETSNSSIASYRANTCRILNAPDKLELGAYYLQPTEGNQGVLLPEGTYVCDTWGGTARIERGGYAQQIKIGDATEINKVLMTRIEDEANPDHNPHQRIRRDISRSVYIPPPPDKPVESNLFSTQQQL